MESSEDIKHMLFNCPRAREVWNCLGMTNILDEVINLDRSGSVVVEEIIKRGGRVQSLDEVGLAELVLVAGWYIWWERRQKVHGENVQAPFRSAMSIRVLAKNYMTALKKPDAKQREGWKKPLEGCLLINVDAAFDEDSGKGAT
jgi:hypothetical protein